MNAIASQCRYEILRTLRNRRFIVMSVLTPIMFYFIFTAVVGNEMLVDGIEWKAYYLISATAFGIIGTNLMTLGVRFAQERTQGWVRMLRIAPASQTGYVLSKMLSQSLINLSTILVMFLIGGLAKGIHLSFFQWAGCALWIWIGAIPFMGLGILAGTLKSAEIVQVVTTILYMGLSILGGLWMPLAIMPEAVRKLAVYLPSFHFGHGAWNVLGSGGFDWSDAVNLVGYAFLFMILSIYILTRQEARQA
ncbi:ABC-2 family transporter protein [compost metagenome]